MPDLKLELRRESLSIRDVFEINKHSFPVLIQVTQGHHGDIDMDTYSTGHLMRVHTYSKQKRVIATDANGRHLSIPVDYHIKFRVCKHSFKVNKEQSLWEILQNHVLPVKVELCSPPPGFSLLLGSHIKNVESFGVLHLLEKYEETYLLANTVVSGTLEDEVLYVPIYLQSILVATVEGIDGKTQIEYQNFLNKLDRVSDCIKFDTSGGNNDIAIYSPESVSTQSENVYDYIQPQHFIKYRATAEKRRPSVPMPKVQDLLEQMEKKRITPQLTPAQNTSGNKYTEFPKGSKGDGSILSSPVPIVDQAPPPIPDRPAVKPNVPPQKHLPRHEYVNDVARATVRPISQTESTLQTATSSRRSSDDAGSSNYVKGFTIDELASRLTALNLGQYVNSFKDAQVSGDLLLDLNEDILREDFDMKRYEAVKLMKYARTGYVPH